MLKLANQAQLSPLVPNRGGRLKTWDCHCFKRQQKSNQCRLTTCMKCESKQIIRHLHTTWIKMVQSYVGFPWISQDVPLVCPQWHQLLSAPRNLFCTTCGFTRTLALKRVLSYARVRPNSTGGESSKGQVKVMQWNCENAWYEIHFSLSSTINSCPCCREARYSMPSDIMWYDMLCDTVIW